VRTSVDHGTALDIAGKGKADASSLVEAVKLAIDLARPRKRYGQHFLHDPRVLAHLVEALQLSKDDFVVEIGPGEGALTYRLLDKVGRLEVIEIDRDLAATPGQGEGPRRRRARVRLLGLSKGRAAGRQFAVQTSPHRCSSDLEQLLHPRKSACKATERRP